MLLLTQSGEIINLDRMAIIDTSSFNIYARQGIGERGIILGGYNTESRCYEIIGNIFDDYCCDERIFKMPEE